MTIEDKKYYVYLHIKEDTGEPFYVGKGKNNRAYETGKRRSNYWNNIVNKHGFDIIFLEIDLTEQEALEREIYWIKRIGRHNLGLGPLVNFTDGGEGTSGIKISEETREKMRIANTGKNKDRKHTDKSKLNMSLAQIGKQLSDDTKNKISKSNTGKIPGEYARKKASETHKDKNYTEETRNKISESHKKLYKKIVLQYDNFGNFIKKWDDQHLAAEFFNIRVGNIISVCEGHRKTYKKYIWKYEK